MEPIKEEQIGNYKLVVSYDEYADNPRIWDDCSVIYSNHKRLNPDNHSIDEIIGEDGELHTEGMVAMRVYLYQHGGYSFSVTELDGENPYNDSYRKWDSGLFGIIAMRKGTAESEFNGEEHAKNWLRMQIECYERYVNGEVYRYDIIEPNGEVYGSCGDYSSADDAFEDGKNEVMNLLCSIAVDIEKALDGDNFDEMKRAYLEVKPNESAKGLLDAISEGVKPIEFLRGELGGYINQLRVGLGVN